MDFSIETSPDGTNWDDTPVTSIRIDKDTDPNQLMVTLRDPAPYVRGSFDQTGATNSHNVRCSWVGSRWDVS